MSCIASPQGHNGGIVGKVRGISGTDTCANAVVMQKILAGDPFESIDETGVGLLMEIAVQKGRSVKPDLKLGICGEHGGSRVRLRSATR